MAKVITAQGIFNFVYKFIVKQGEPAIAFRSCKYRARGEGGKILACAAGCLLSDDEAKGLDEDSHLGASWRDIVSRKDTPKRFDKFEDLINELQKAHDASARSGENFVPAFKFRMKRLAASHGLTVPE